MNKKKQFLINLFQKKNISDTLHILPVSVLLLISAAHLGGCKEAAPPIPEERAKLVARFFQSIQNKDVKAAMRQGVKLRSLDKYNENIIRLVEIQQCNAYINEAQKAVNSGDINKAVAVLRQGVTQYPDNVTLRELLPRVRQLRNARSLLEGMKKASNSIAMRSALTAARIGLYVNTTPALNRYFDQYEKKILEVEKAEQLKARAEAEKRAKEEALKRAEAEKKAAEEAQKKAEAQPAEPSQKQQPEPAMPQRSAEDKK